MAIDPMLYEKYSGRSADPTQQLGEALAGSSKRSSQIGGGEDDGGRPDGLFLGLKAQWWASIILSIVVLAVVLGVFVRW